MESNLKEVVEKKINTKILKRKQVKKAKVITEVMMANPNQNPKIIAKRLQLPETMPLHWSNPTMVKKQHWKKKVS